MPLLVWIVLCAALGGIASAALAVVFLWMSEAHAARILPHFVSFATGALLGAALLALLPEAIAGAGVAASHAIGLTLIAGLGVFFVIEKLVLWWHIRGEEETEPEHAQPHRGHAQHAHSGHSHRRADGGDRRCVCTYQTARDGVSSRPLPGCDGDGSLAVAG